MTGRRLTADENHQRVVRTLRAIYKDTRPKNERLAYTQALFTLADLLRVDGEDLHFIIWIMELGYALDDLNHGIVRPLFQAKNSKAMPTNEWRVFAFASIGMRAFTMAGASRGDAARQAVRAIPGINADQKTVLDRYDEFQKGRIKNRSAAMYNDAVAGFKKMDRAALGVAAREFFSMARKQLSHNVRK
jgi:hypothetical protein